MTPRTTGARPRAKFLTLALATAAGVAAWRGLPPADGPAHAGQGDPTAPAPPDRMSPRVPPDAEFDEQPDPAKNLAHFADFAWRDFVAVCWPADDRRRGEPHATKALGDPSAPPVWGTWKAMDELFPADPVADPPTPWDSFAANLAARRTDERGHAKVLPLDLGPPREAGRVKVLGSVSKLEDVNQAGFGEIEYPLVAQNRTFVRYEIRVNRPAYDFVRDHKYYLKDKLPADGAAPLEFPDQSLIVKAAWRELPDDPAVRARFYHTPAKVVDWTADGTPVLADRTVGLIGLHVVHKTPKRKNWVWATFEHVDNTERSPGGLSPSLCRKGGGARFGDPGTNEFPHKVEAGRPLPKSPTPVEVARKTPVPAAVAQVNDRYRGHAQVKDTVWRNYRLVAVQWPTPPGDGALALRFPKADVANVTMETYHQGVGCMSCHGAAARSKFVFFVEMRAVGDKESGNSSPKAVDRLRDFLDRARDRAPPK
jgi:hypothetical protein